MDGHRTMKTEYLVLHDYGMGGVWAILLARSKQEIQQKYPSLEIYEVRPSWMSDDQYDIVRKNFNFDIDNPPEGWLAKM